LEALFLIRLPPFRGRLHSRRPPRASRCSRSLTSVMSSLRAFRFQKDARPKTQPPKSSNEDEPEDDPAQVTRPRRTHFETGCAKLSISVFEDSLCSSPQPSSAAVDDSCHASPVLAPAVGIREYVLCTMSYVLCIMYYVLCTIYMHCSKGDLVHSIDFARTRAVQCATRPFLRQGSSFVMAYTQGVIISPGTGYLFEGRIPNNHTVYYVLIKKIKKIE
jgi:hypothetical protein